MESVIPRISDSPVATAFHISWIKFNQVDDFKPAKVGRHLCVFYSEHYREILNPLPDVTAWKKEAKKPMLYFMFWRSITIGYGFFGPFSSFID